MILIKLTIYINRKLKFCKNDRFNLAILESLKQYIYVFKEKKILKMKKKILEIYLYFRNISKMLFKMIKKLMLIFQI